MSNHPTPHVPNASPLGTSGETSTGISDVLLDQPAGGDDATVLDWRAPPGTLQPADASFNAATATQPTTGRDRTLPPLELSDWPEGQQIPEQAGYSPDPIAAEAAHAEADLPNVPPVDASVTRQYLSWRSLTL